MGVRASAVPIWRTTLKTSPGRGYEMACTPVHGRLCRDGTPGVRGDRRRIFHGNHFGISDLAHISDPEGFIEKALFINL